MTEEEKQREQRIKINDFKTLQKKYRTDLQKKEAQLMNQLRADLKELVDEIGKKHQRNRSFFQVSLLMRRREFISVK